MNLYEWEGKQLFVKHGIASPRGMVVRRGEDVKSILNTQSISLPLVAKAQILSGKRGKNNGIRFCSTASEADAAVQDLFSINIRGQYVASVLLEEKLDIAEEHYLSITYDTNRKQPVLIYSPSGGMEIEDVGEEEILREYLDVREPTLRPPPNLPQSNPSPSRGGSGWGLNKSLQEIVQSLWNCFLQEDARLVEINPLVKTTDGRWVAADAKVSLDDDAFYRHEEWKNLEPRTMLGRSATEREIMARKIDDEGEKYYQGTAGKYIEMDGDIATLFSSAGASINNMDALANAGLKPANYTEYSGNPPREKVYQLTKIVLSKPGIKGLWIVGGVANFTNVEETFRGVIDALDEVKPLYPIVVRRAGPFEKEGMKLMAECAERNKLNMKLFGKETAMDETANILADMMRESTETI